MARKGKERTSDRSLICWDIYGTSECPREFQDGVRESNSLSLRQLGGCTVPTTLTLGLVLLVDLARRRDCDPRRQGASTEAREHVACRALAGASREKEKVRFRELDGGGGLGAGNYSGPDLQPRDHWRPRRNRRNAWGRLSDLDRRRLGCLLGREAQTTDAVRQSRPGPRGGLVRLLLSYRLR